MYDMHFLVPTFYNKMACNNSLGAIETSYYLHDLVFNPWWEIIPPVWSCKYAILVVLMKVMLILVFIVLLLKSTSDIY